MARPDISLPDELAEPMFCRAPDDFPLMMMQISKAIWAEDEDADRFFTFLTLSFKIVCHEYMACVLSGKIKPYRFNQEFKGREYEMFRECILSAKEDAIKAGVPMVETNDGKFAIDVEALARRQNQ